MKERFFSFARECALNSDFHKRARFHVGCVVVWKNSIIAKSNNRTTTHTIQWKYNIKYRPSRFNTSSNRYYPSYVHAEIAALSKIKYLDIDFSKVDVYVYRELWDGTRACARPCIACESFMRDLGITHVCYTMENSFVEEWYT